MKLYFKTPLGTKLFAVVTHMYYNECGIFPTVDDEFPKYMNTMGYRATYISDYFADTLGGRRREIQSKGIDIPDEDLVAFRLRFGI